MQILSAFRESSNYILLYVKIIANAKENKILGEIINNNQTYLKISIKALKINNQANIMLIKYLSNLLVMPQRDINVKVGKTYSYKILELHNKSLNKIQEALYNVN